MQNRISVELSLAAACCRWPPSPGRVEAVRQAAAKGVNWNQFDAVVARNRIGPLVHHGLVHAGIAPPPDIARRFSHRAAMAARHGLAIACESLHLQQTFEAAGLPSIIFKGAPLAIIAYHDLGMKESLDIDILIPCEKVPLAIDLLRNIGYESDIGRLKHIQLDGYLRHAKEASFINRKAGLIVDLHWRMVDTKRLLSGIGIQGPAQKIPVPGGQLRTLATEELFAYLCVHGAVHNWARLKWIADIGALLGDRSHEEIERLCATAEYYGATRAARIAVALCHRLLGVELSEKLQAHLHSSRILQALQANALAGLAYEERTLEPARYSRGRLRKLAAQFLLVPGLRHALDQARFYWNYPTDRARLALPRQLGFIYGALRIPLWIVRLAARACRIRAT